MSVDDHQGRRTAARFFGALLIAAGGLIAALCGLCTLVFVVSGLSSSSDGSMVVLALVIGGVPTVFGGLVIWGGVALFRGPRRRETKVKPETFE